MSERSQVLADRFATANAELQRLIAEASDAQLARSTQEEGWSALVVAHHIALSYRVVGSWIKRVAAGQTIPTTRAQIDEGNAQMAQDATPFTRADALTLLRDNGARTETLIRDLSDEQLAATATMMPAEGRQMTTEQVIKHVLLHHIKEHSLSLRPLLSADTASA